MVTIMDVIKKRRSVRNYKNKKVEKKIIKELILAGTWAPSGSNIQSWKFVIVDNNNIKEKIDTFSPGLMGNPPNLIVFCYDKELAYEKGGKLGRDELGKMDICMAAQNIMLLATEKNISTCPVKSFNSNALKKILKLPDYIDPVLIVSLGYSDKQPSPPNRKSVDQVSFYNEWGD